MNLRLGDISLGKEETMKNYDVEVKLKAVVSVEAKNQREAKELAIEVVASGYFENGIEDASAKIVKG